MNRKMDRIYIEIEMLRWRREIDRYNDKEKEKEREKERDRQIE